MHNRRGFTLLELIVVLVVLSVLVSIALPQYEGFVEKGRAAEVYGVFDTIKISQEAYKLNTGNYATHLSDLTDLTLPDSGYWTYDMTAFSTFYMICATRTGKDTAQWQNAKIYFVWFKNSNTPPTWCYQPAGYPGAPPNAVLWPPPGIVM
jgi:prepilin-type N-terminal cleavage/methylation domain-containing protein